MKAGILTAYLLCFCLGSVNAVAGQAAFDRSAFYAAMASSRLDEIEQQLTALKTLALPEKEAYEGALLMKKSGLVTKAKEKLSLFKAGRSKLENSIAREIDNPEFRFLRLIIQEHAPRIVNYRNELEKDSKLIRSGFKSLPDIVQTAILDYCKKSTVLKASYF